MDEDTTNAEAFSHQLADSDHARYVLTLYITGVTPKSTRALNNIKALCEEHLAGRYELNVVDIYQQPERAVEEQIVAAPTLIKLLPLPLRKLVGDMSNEERVLAGLGLSLKIIS